MNSVANYKIGLPGVFLGSSWRLFRIKYMESLRSAITEYGRGRFIDPFAFYQSKFQVNTWDFLELSDREFLETVPAKIPSGNLNRARNVGRIVQTIMRKMVHGSYLDIGAGDGKITSEIAQVLKLSPAYALDLESFAGEEIEKKENIKYISYENGGTGRIPLDHVNFITMFQTLHHIRDLSLLNEIRRLRPDYILVREHHVRDSADRALVDLEHLLYSAARGVSYDKFAAEFYSHYFSKKELKTMFDFPLDIPVQFSSPYGPSRTYFQLFGS